MAFKTTRLAFSGTLLALNANILVPDTNGLSLNTKALPFSANKVPQNGLLEEPGFAVSQWLPVYTRCAWVSRNWRAKLRGMNRSTPHLIDGRADNLNLTEGLCILA